MAFLVRATGNGFRVVEETYKPARKVVTVPESSYAALGFRKDMPLSEAKARAKQLNTQKNLESKKIANSARRVELLKSEASAYLPQVDVIRFEKELADMYLDNPYRHEVTLRYWRAAQLAVLELAVDPKDFRSANHRFLNYFKNQKWSQDYIKRITRMLNMWGTSVCRQRGSLFEPLPKLDSIQVQKIHEAREDVEGIRRPSEPLRWPVLKAKKETFAGENLENQWNWLFVATWFGLRPHEVDNLKKGSRFWYTKFDSEAKVDVLWVYQPKLVRLEKEKRWKPIPIFCREQKEALKIIIDGEFKRPLNKTLQRIFDEGIQVASPRKAFTDLMLERGFELEDVSTFLGHQKIEMLWRHYKDRQRFKLPKKRAS